MYKLAVLAAGRGTRLGELVQHINKAMLPVGKKAIISHIVDKVPAEVEVVVAMGYKSRELREYLEMAHPGRKWHFVEVDNITGAGAGPGYSLLRCRDLLQCPFVLTTADTMVVEEIPAPTENWLGVSPVIDTSVYNSVKLTLDRLVTNMRDKARCDNTHAFIGLAGIRDWPVFWDALASDESLIKGERQLSNGLKALQERRLQGRFFTWFDTGTAENYERTCRYFTQSKDDFSFAKTGEHIYFVGERVIKFYDKPAVVKQRVERAHKLAGFVPRIERSSENLYMYRFVPGKTLYKSLTEKKAKEFFAWLQRGLWRPVVLSPEEEAAFQEASYRFYHDKTKERVEKYFAVTGEDDGAGEVNDVAVPALRELLGRVDWAELTRGLPSPFHGDLQFDNVIVSEEPSRPFVLIDWRQDFGGLVDWGDRYYDLAKMYGGMLNSYDAIKRGQFRFEQEGRKVTLDVSLSYTLTRCRDAYVEFLQENGYDVRRVQLLTALIFLNMSPLHLPPFNYLLHHLGKLELQRVQQLSSLKVTGGVARVAALV